MDNLYLPSREAKPDTLNTVEFPPIGLDFGTSNSVLAHYTDEFHQRGAYAYALPLLNGRVFSHQSYIIIRLLISTLLGEQPE